MYVCICLMIEKEKKISFLSFFFLFFPLFLFSI